MFSGVFLGTLRSEVLGELEFVDEKNEIKSVLAFGKVKGKYIFAYVDQATISVELLPIRVK